MTIESVVDADYANAVDARLNSYAAYIEYQIQEARRALPFLERFFEPRGARILEIGAGRGGKGIAYALAGMRVVALDIDAEALQLGAANAHSRHASIQFLAGAGEQLAFPANHFDAILLDSVIEHVQNPLRVLQECFRVLKPGGIVFVVFPPFYGPLSGHIDDYVMMPWFHLLPRRVVERELLKHQPIGILTPREAFAVFSSLNGLTIFRLREFVRRAGFHFDYWRVRPFLTHPGMRLVVGLVSALKNPPRLKNAINVIARARREFSVGTFCLFLLLSVLAPLVLVPFLQEIAAGGCKTVLRKPE